MGEVIRFAMCETEWGADVNRPMRPHGARDGLVPLSVVECFETSQAPCGDASLSFSRRCFSLPSATDATPSILEADLASVSSLISGALAAVAMLAARAAGVPHNHRGKRGVGGYSTIDVLP